MRLLTTALVGLFAFVATAQSSFGQHAADAAAAKARDIPANVSTKAMLKLGAPVYGSLETAGDSDWFRMELKAGRTYQVRVLGFGVKELNDPRIELRDASGNSIGTVDDRAAGESWGGPNVTDPVGYINIAANGTFYLDIQSFVSGDTADDVGDYLVTLVEGPADLSFFFTLDEIAWQLTNNYWEWFGYDGAIAFDLGPDGALTYNVSKLTPAGARLAEAALDAWTDVAGIKFIKTGGLAELDFDDSDAGVNAYSTPDVSLSTIRTSQIMITTGWLNQFGTSFGSYSYETYLHQIGQALGLGRAGNYNGTIDGQYYKNDSVAYSVMSFSQAANDEFTQGQPANNPNVDASFRYMQTMGVADIIAIRKLYGRRTETRAGDTTYGFGANTGDPALDGAAKLGADMFMTVYDDGGRDTLDFNRAKAAQTIDLNPEAASNVLGGKMNLWIARGADVEDAVGGSAKDRLVGNELANGLTGGGGKDVFVFSSKLGAVDRIEDFDVGDDMIELSKAVFSGLPTGDLASGAFKDLGVAGAKVDASDRILYDRGTGALSYDPDGDGEERAVRFATLRNKARLKAANVVVK